MSALVVLAAAPDLPPGDDWLRPRERAALLRLRAPKRRRDFRLGRFTARRALALLEDRPQAPPHFEVRRGPGGVPLAFCDGASLPVTLSISHSDGWASAAVHRGSEPLGCDLEHVEPRSAAILSDYFTPRERAFVAEGTDLERSLRSTLVWSAKEAVMKALGEGLRLPPATVEVSLAWGPMPSGTWRPFSVLGPPRANPLRGSWRAVGAFVLTVAGGQGEPRFIETCSSAASTAKRDEGVCGCRGGPGLRVSEADA